MIVIGTVFLALIVVATLWGDRPSKSDIYLVIVESRHERIMEWVFGWRWDEQSFPLVAAQTSPDSWAAALLVSDIQMKWICDDILGYDAEACYIVFDVKKSFYLGQHYETLWEWLRKAKTLTAAERYQPKENSL